jgi:hypothetical protein
MKAGSLKRNREAQLLPTPPPQIVWMGSRNVPPGDAGESTTAHKNEVATYIYARIFSVKLCRLRTVGRISITAWYMWSNSAIM